MIDIFDFIFQTTQNAKYSVFWSFVAGGMFGLVCIQCVLPLAIYGGAEGSARRGFIFGFLFNLSRLLMFLILGIIAAVSVNFIQEVQSSSPSLYGIAYLITGGTLIAFAAELFGVMNIDSLIASKLINFAKPLFSLNFNVRHIGAIARGFIFSIPCSLEFSLLILGIWGMGALSSDPLFAFLVVSAFGVGNVISTSLAAGIMGSSTGFLEKKTKKNFRKYVSYLGSIIILFIGLSYFTVGLRITGFL